MSAPDQHFTEAAHDQTGLAEPSAPPAPPAETQPVAASEPAAAPESAGTHTHSESADGESLFAGLDMSSLRARWDDVQAAFVDDPRECVQKADHLVSDLVENLTKGFADARTRLEAQWSQGQEASTEELRVALKRYREFFQRLLSV